MPINAEWRRLMARRPAEGRQGSRRQYLGTRDLSLPGRMARAKTARDILEALADHQRDPKALAALAASQIKGGREAVEQAPDGMLLGDHYPRLIRIHLDHITFLDRSITAIEDQIRAALDAIPATWGISADGVPSPDPGPDAAALCGPAGRGDPRCPSSSRRSPASARSSRWPSLPRRART
jgi:hypothetical protein